MKDGAAAKPKIWLLEFDKRFSVFPEFVPYDFKQPWKLPRECLSFSAPMWRAC
jgi:hypothetical protein